MPFISTIVAAVGLTGFAATAVTLGLQLLTTFVVSSLIARSLNKAPEQTGGRVQLPPATDNKLPIVYGEAVVSPIIVDAKISADQQTMWYVLAFSEATDGGDVSFNRVYWDDKILLFDPNNPNEIRGWYRESDDTTVTGVGGKISMWFYKNGSLTTGTTHRCVSTGGVGSFEPTTLTAIQVMQDFEIPGELRWTDNHLMTNTVFAICRVRYDQNVNITGLGQIRAEIINTLNAPGDVIVDYLKNDRYGCGVTTSSIKLSAFEDLNTYSAGQITLQNTTGGLDTGTRYTLNGVVDPTKNCLDNLVALADSADSWIQWSEATGQWSVLMNRSIEEAGLTTSTITVVTADQIIGGIQVNPLDLNATYNNIAVQFPNNAIKDQTDYRYYSIDPSLRFANEPDNKLTLTLPFANNSLQATYIGYKRLFASREDINITFTMDYSGIQIDAGDVICVNHEFYGWTTATYGDQIYPGKPFRVMQVREVKDESGFLSAHISASAYNGEVYTSLIPHFFTDSSFSGITDPQIIGKPGTPSFPAELVNSTATTYVVRSTVPQQGNTIGMEFWYSVKGPSLVANNYSLYGTEYYATTSTGGVNTAIYPYKITEGPEAGQNFYEDMRTYAMPTGTYYWRTRAVGPNTVSDFSEPGAFNWVLSNPPVSGDTILDNTIGGSKVITGQTNNNGSKSKGFFSTLGPILIGGLAVAAIGGLFKKGGSKNKTPKNLLEGVGWAGNDYGTTKGDYNTWYDNGRMYGDQSPFYENPKSWSNKNGFKDYGNNNWNSNTGFFGGWI